MQRRQNEPARNRPSLARFFSSNPLKGNALHLPLFCHHFLTLRYFCPKVHSVNLDDIPRKPTKIIQKVAPGPPVPIAIATPAIFPNPTVADKAVVNAWKGVTSPNSCLHLNFPLTNFIAMKKKTNINKPEFESEKNCSSQVTKPRLKAYLFRELAKIAHLRELRQCIPKKSYLIF